MHPIPLFVTSDAPWVCGGHSLAAHAASCWAAGHPCFTPFHIPYTHPAVPRAITRFSSYILHSPPLNPFDSSLPHCCSCLQPCHQLLACVARPHPHVATHLDNVCGTRPGTAAECTGHADSVNPRCPCAHMHQAAEHAQALQTAARRVAALCLCFIPVHDPQSKTDPRSDPRSSAGMTPQPGLLPLPSPLWLAPLSLTLVKGELPEAADTLALVLASAHASPSASASVPAQPNMWHTSTPPATAVPPSLLLHSRPYGTPTAGGVAGRAPAGAPPPPAQLDVS